MEIRQHSKGQDVDSVLIIIKKTIAKQSVMLRRIKLGCLDDWSESGWLVEDTIMIENKA